MVRGVGDHVDAFYPRYAKGGSDSRGGIQRSLMWRPDRTITRELPSN